MAKKKKVKKPTHDQQKDLLTRFGTSVNWVEVNLPMTFDEVKSYFGPECEEYNHLCGCCIAWAEWHKTHKVTVTLERKEIIKILDS